MKLRPADFDHGAELLEENRRLRARVEELEKASVAKDETLKKERDAWLWADEKREKRRNEEIRAMRGERDAARGALTKLADEVARDADGELAEYVAELRRDGGVE